MKKVKKINVLGTDYTIEHVNISECPELKDNGWCGSCNDVSHKILIGNPEEVEFYGETTEEEREKITKQTLRHEIIHAFLSESGLQDCSHRNERAWTRNEEMIDWIAIQFPKILDVFRELDCL